MLIRLIIVLISCLIPISSYAFNLTAEGYGANREEAKKNALATLSEALQVEVKSQTDIFKHTQSGSIASQRIQTLSELPLLGVEFTFIDKHNEKHCLSMLNSSKAASLYKEKLILLRKSFSTMHTQLKQSSQNAKYLLLSDMLAKHDQFDKYLLVARLIGVTNTPSLSMTMPQIKAEMLSIESAVPSLELAAKLLTRNLSDQRLYVYVALPQGSQEATELGRALRDKIMVNVKTTDDRNNASLVMKGHYDIHKDGISVTYRLIDNFGETHATRVVKLAKSAYKNMAYKSASIDFSKLLHEGYVVSNKFHAEINTNRGKTGLLYTDGEDVELFARVNKPGYFYIVTHNSTANNSYLMELSEASGHRKFVQYVNADQANRWISLGAFEVGAPFGVENLQLIASNNDLIDQLPPVALDHHTNLYLLKEASINSAILKTRGLKRKKNANKEKFTSEATLTITTMK